MYLLTATASSVCLLKNKERSTAACNESWDMLGYEWSASLILLQQGIRNVHLQVLINWDSLHWAAVTQSVYKYTLRRMWPLHLSSAAGTEMQLVPHAKDTKEEAALKTTLVCWANEYIVKCALRIYFLSFILSRSFSSSLAVSHSGLTCTVGDPRLPAVVNGISPFHLPHRLPANVQEYGQKDRRVQTEGFILICMHI